ncbi:MAG: hypothetical protein JO135_06505 [Candidatus Eremiobacteraeota bacterium]|nr:hypothetical protein [Candidatus Eremiobacteraeota bacterium]
MNYSKVACAVTLFAAATFFTPAGAQTAPSPVATPTPAVAIPPALPPIIKYEQYVSAGYIAPPIVCNEFSACFPGNRYQSVVFRAAAEFPVARAFTAMVKVDFRRYGYPHYGVAGPPLACAAGSTDLSCVPAIGGNGAANSVGAFTARNWDYDVRAGFRVIEPRIYLSATYLQRTNNYGYPRLSGYGVSLEKLPDVDQILSLYGGAQYYPIVRGNFTDAAGTTFNLAYHVLRYDVGLTLKPSTYSPLFIDAGYLGDNSHNAGNAPSNITRSGPYVGIGLTL